MDLVFAFSFYYNITGRFLSILFLTHDLKAMTLQTASVLLELLYVCICSKIHSLMLILHNRSYLVCTLLECLCEVWLMDELTLALLCAHHDHDNKHAELANTNIIQEDI